jgi:hypothetical protein
MRVVTTTAILVSVFAGVPSALRARQSVDRPSVSATERARSPDDPNGAQMVQTYCAGCHNGVMRSPSGALLDRFDTATIADNPDVWSRAYRQLQAGTMPPFGAPRPGRNACGKLLSSIETALGANASPPADATNQEIADRLATLLWNSAPDAALLADVRRNRLTRPDRLEKQIQRMLAEDRADAFVLRFFFPARSWTARQPTGASSCARPCCSTPRPSARRLPRSC